LSYINLTDTLETIKTKIAKIPTDEGKGEEITGGVKSLFDFIELFQGKERRNLLEEQYKTTGVRYGEIKSELSEAIFNELRPLQEKRQKLENDSAYVESVIAEGAEKARKVASQTLQEVREKMGLA